MYLPVEVPFWRGLLEAVERRIPPEVGLGGFTRKVNSKPNKGTRVSLRSEESLLFHSHAKQRNVELISQRPVQWTLIFSNACRLFQESEVIQLWNTTPNVKKLSGLQQWFLELYRIFVKTHLRTMMFTHQIHQQYSNCTDSRQILKEIELVSHMVWSSIGIFHVLKREKFMFVFSLTYAIQKKLTACLVNIALEKRYRDECDIGFRVQFTVEFTRHHRGSQRAAVEWRLHILVMCIFNKWVNGRFKMFK